MHRWDTGKLMAHAVASQHRLFAVACRPDSPSEFVTVGVKHIHFWTLAGSTLLSKKGLVGRQSKMTTMLAVAFGPDAITYSAAMNGEIWLWKENKLMKQIHAHDKPCFTLSTWTGGRSWKVVSGGKVASCPCFRISYFFFFVFVCLESVIFVCFCIHDVMCACVQDGKIKVWDAATFSKIEEAAMEGKELRSVTLNDRNTCLVGTESRCVCV